MRLTEHHIGELIELVTETNQDLIYGPNDVMGMTITKEVIPTKAKVAETDLSRFIVVQPGYFIFNPRTHGKKIGFGYNDTGKPFIISWNNVAFRIMPSQQDQILADYLFLHFNRDEWDREACYRSWGSSTEVFSWDALCEMEILVPPFPIQQKYVAIYKAMVANQQSYERGLDDLKLTFDAVKHSASNRFIGDLLYEIDIRNSDGKVDNVQGINITKQFMPSVANTTGVDLKKYKVVSKGQFAFSGMQTGRDECIRFALYGGEEPIIISPAYTVFKNKSDDVLPEYIMMWFSRRESDRRGWFMSDGSIRTNLDLERLYEIEIPVPDLSTQKSVVNIYTAFTNRRAINEKMKSQIKDICPILIRGSLEYGG